MGSIGCYIVRATLSAFRAIRLRLVAIGWRDVGLITREGETALAGGAIMSLVIPRLVLVTAPIAMVIVPVLNKLATEAAVVTERLTRRLATT